jgi:hypothetical protein
MLCTVWMNITLLNKRLWLLFAFIHILLSWQLIKNRLVVNH